MTAACTFPACSLAVCCRNNAGQPMCDGHLRVTVSGSWVPDAHTVSSHE